MSNPITSLIGRTPRDPDLQAGSRGLSIREVITRYFESPGQVLTLLRSVRDLTVEQLAATSGATVNAVLAYEAGTRSPTPKDAEGLSRALGADLRVFLQAFGQIQPGASSESMGIAAQHAGDMSETEKLDLKKLVESIVAARSRGDQSK